MKRLLLIGIGGAGGYDSMAFVVMRDFHGKLKVSVEQMHPGVTVTLMEAVYGDISSLKDIVDAIPGFDIIVIEGHSHGAFIAIRLANGDFGAVGKIDLLVSLDCIPTIDKGWELGADPTLPPNVDDAVEYYGVLDPLFGKPFKTDSRVSVSELRSLPHDQFTGDYSINSEIADKVDALAANILAAQNALK